MYVSTGDWAEHLLRQGPSSFKQYVEVWYLIFWVYVDLIVCTEVSEVTYIT
jgi:hypothetical protein